MKIYLPPNAVGKSIRLNKILPDGKAVIFAFDHGVEHGPKDFPPWHMDPRAIISKVVEEGVDGIMTTKGVAIHTWDLWAGRVPLILKLTGKTSLRPKDEQLLQSPIALVEDALKLDADAVAVTVYWGSQYEDAMLRFFVEVAHIANDYGLPVLQLAYPRGPAIQNRYDVEIVRYGARAAMELGADIIKTYWTGSKETFAEVVKAATPVPVLLSGGAKKEKLEEFLEIVKAVMDAGGKGAVVGRNIFQRKNPEAALRAIKLVVHEGVSVKEAVESIR